MSTVHESRKISLPGEYHAKRGMVEIISLAITSPYYNFGSRSCDACSLRMATQTELMIVIAITRHRDGDHEYAEFCRRLWASCDMKYVV